MHANRNPRWILAVSLTFMLSSAAFAAGEHHDGHGHGHGHGDHGHAHAHDADIGEAAMASQATRIVEIVMTDNSYAPASISVEQGETVRFVVRNKGETVHEFNIGTAAMHAAHQKEMAMMFERGMMDVDRIHHDKMRMGGMAHDDPNSVLLEPGKEGEIVWKFSRRMELEFACNLPGHYESGMVGRFHIR